MDRPRGFRHDSSRPEILDRGGAPLTLDPRLLSAALLAAVLLAAGCSDRDSPLEPTPGTFTLSGRVRLVAENRGELGEFLGAREVHDADGVRVRLAGPGGSADSTLTVGGAFHFQVDEPGRYRASVWIVPPDTIQATDVAVAATATASFPDTLVLGPAGDVAVHPNPFPSAHGLAIEFTTVAAQRVGLSAFDLAGVRRYHDEIDLPATFFMHYHWTGVNDDFEPLPIAPYWIVIRRDGGTHARLAFKE